MTNNVRRTTDCDDQRQNLTTTYIIHTPLYENEHKCDYYEFFEFFELFYCPSNALIFALF